MMNWRDPMIDLGGVRVVPTETKIEAVRPDPVDADTRASLIALGWTPPTHATASAILLAIDAVLKKLRREHLLTEADADRVYADVRASMTLPPR